MVWAGADGYKSDQVAERLQNRRAQRRSRRNRHTRYRPARFNNRRRPAGWLSPSMRSRIGNTDTWVARLRRCCPVSGLALELVKFDTQQMDQPEISGVEYQQGELAGYRSDRGKVRRPRGNGAPKLSTSRRRVGAAATA